MLIWYQLSPWGTGLRCSGSGGGAVNRKIMEGCGSAELELAMLTISHANRARCVCLQT